MSITGELLGMAVRNTQCWVCYREEYTAGGRDGALSEGTEGESQGAMSAQTAARLYEGQCGPLEILHQRST